MSDQPIDQNSDNQAVDAQAQFEEQQKRNQLEGMRQSARILANLRGLLSEGLYSGEHAAVVAECRQYVNALAGRAAADLKGLEVQTLAEQPGNRKQRRASKRILDRVLGKKKGE